MKEAEEEKQEGRENRVSAERRRIRPVKCPLPVAWDVTGSQEPRENGSRGERWRK